MNIPGSLEASRRLPAKWKPYLRGNARRAGRTLRQRVRVARAQRSQQAQVDAYLRSAAVPRLQIGTLRNTLPGWLNTDIIIESPGVVYLDATRRFPMPDRSLRYVFNEHVIEHLPYEQGQVMLRECFRVLQPGGTIRIATPSLDYVAGLLQRDLSEADQRYIRFMVDTWTPGAPYSPSVVLNNNARNWGHQFLYDWDTVHDALTECGFVNVVRRTYGESTDELLCGLEVHGRSFGELGVEVGRLETMVVEATRP